MWNVEKLLYEQHTGELFSSKELPSSLRSSNSPFPPKRSEAEWFSPYLPPACELSVKENTNAETPEESNAHQDQET